MIGKCNTGGGKPEEEKTVTAGTSAIVVLPSSGKTMKKVTVNPTPTEEKTVTPTTSQQTVSPSNGKHLAKVIVEAMEDVTPEVTAQTPVITQIAENLGVTITTPSGTNKQILQGNNTNLLNIKNNAKKEGLYVWKKLTAQDGDFVDFVVSDSPTAYPDGGEQGGYWYELFDLKSFGIDFGEVTLASSAASVTVSHNLGVVPSWVALIPKSLATTNSSSLFNINGKTAYSAMSSNPLIHVESAANTLSAEEITFATHSNPFAATGYYWFALA